MKRNAFGRVTRWIERRQGNDFDRERRAQGHAIFLRRALRKRRRRQPRGTHRGGLCGLLLDGVFGGTGQSRHHPGIDRDDSDGIARTG